jgi:hypothetical protein
MLHYLFAKFMEKLTAQAERRNYLPFILGATLGGAVYAGIALGGGFGLMFGPLVGAVFFGALVVATCAPLAAMSASQAKNVNFGTVHAVWQCPPGAVAAGNRLRQVVALCDHGVFSLTNDPNGEAEAIDFVERGQFPDSPRAKWTELKDIESITFVGGNGNPTRLQCFLGSPQASVALYLADEARDGFLTIYEKLIGRSLDSQIEPMPRKEALLFPCIFAGIVGTFGLICLVTDLLSPPTGPQRGASLTLMGLLFLLVASIYPLYIFARWPKITRVRPTARAESATVAVKQQGVREKSRVSP